MVAALVAAAVLIPAGFHEAKALEPAASYVAGKHATVLCADTWGDWQQYTAANQDTGDVNGLTVVGSSQSELAPQVCTALINRLHRQPQPLFNSAAGILILVHEAIHQRGVGDEGQTECTAIHEMPRVAVRFFGYKAGKPLRALMAQAWNSHREKPAVYQSVC